MHGQAQDARATAVLPAGTWQGSPIDEVLIDFDQRFRRRFLLHTQHHRHVLLDLPQAVRLRDGDGLSLEDGSIILVRARPENLLKITAPGQAALTRIAWHLGNRHLPVQLTADCILIRADHVIAEMIIHLGGTVQPLEAAFDPEAGAYAGGHSHAGDDEDHGHDH